MPERIRPANVRVLASLALSAAIGLVPNRAHACAIASPPNQTVSVEHEDALIAWDEATHTEHFIRKAVFESNASDFGFLVPTPTQPVLAEADESLFSHLEALTRPEVTYEPRFVPVMLCALPFLRLGHTRGGAPVPAAAEPVRVLDVQRVAGLDAAVLEADSAGALGEWLKGHGYPFRPALVEWATPYVEKKWKITAFKLADNRVAAKEPDESGAWEALPPTAGPPGRAHLVRMSFTTEQPFYPYREPADSRSGALRELRLYLLASARLDGALERGAWAGTVDYAQPEEHAGALQPLVEGIPGSLSPGWLTSFRDNAQVRPQADLFFKRGAQATVKPPPTVNPMELPVPIDLLLLVGVGVTLIVRRTRTKSAPLPPDP